MLPIPSMQMVAIRAKWHAIHLDATWLESPSMLAAIFL